MSAKSRTLTRSSASSWRRTPYLIGTLLRLPLILALYTLVVFAAFAFGIGIIDLFRLGPNTPSIWPELQALTGNTPGGLLFLAPLLILAASLAARGLDRAFDTLHRE